MVGLYRDRVAAAPSIPDPCSHYKTKMKDVIDELKRWVNDWGDVENEREEASEKLHQTTANKQQAQADLDASNREGGDAAAIGDATKRLQKATEDEVYARRAFEILNDRLRHFDASLKDLHDRYDFLSKELSDCEAVIARDRAGSSPTA